ncbi:MAG: HPF/RaiA family ribosome-associated protein [Deltaproteobacteria bacterium]|nr:HPF/RaiA family ribosome-associated protein [Deltaproteobacteria bacterium]
MQLPLQITAHDFPLSEAIEAEIREKAAKLDKHKIFASSIPSHVSHH